MLHLKASALAALAALCCARVEAVPVGGSLLRKLGLGDGALPKKEVHPLNYAHPRDDVNHVYGHPYQEANFHEMKPALHKDGYIQGSAQTGAVAAFFAMPGAHWKAVPGGKMLQTHGKGAGTEIKYNPTDHFHDVSSHGRVVGSWKGVHPQYHGIYDKHLTPVHSMGPDRRPDAAEAESILVNLKTSSKSQRYMPPSTSHS
ncbi:hypothetical protein IE81DRAFT_326027 [Ceraceosorus guamensis]|uniref:Uncharacterized protein n=1 Tax=Ceraceosorus guamensis TaxID=1522189 RepID=A0A316VWU5_9BASI|nr:hypothetical protein IE81DRAFT_326027 [Ceraceosorus guamensis]PWN39935.1 hypothetical protein IE81DRAFT_326027 [Ceraceosorus guamensis]